MIEARITVAGCDHEEAIEHANEVLPAGFVYDDSTPESLLITSYVETFEAVPPIVTALESQLGGKATISAEIAPLQDGWEERWKEFHKPVVMGGMWIGPPWLEPPADKRTIIIDPGQGFGTGSHPTTWMCLEFLAAHRPDSISREHDSLVDIGCGSGILAIAGRQLGFSPVIAFDNDAVAVENARRNMDLNGVKVELSVRDGLSRDLPKADVAVANILLEPLRALAPRLNSDIAIISGLLRSQFETANAAYEEVGFRLRERRDREGWLALRYER